MTDEEFTVELPGGGAPLPLRSREEVDRWQTLEAAYVEQYDLRRINDQTNLGMLLVQQINLYRAQLGLTGRVPELDQEELPTGRMVTRQLKPAEAKAFQEQMTNASKEIRAIEQTMGIDKKSRDQAGDETLRSWQSRMKARAHRYGLHVNKRVHAYEQFCMELRWRLRLNVNGDAEDKHYEDCTEEGIIKWARAELEELERRDKEFAQSEGNALVVGSTS